METLNMEIDDMETIEINPLVVEIEKAARSSKLIEFYKLMINVRNLVKETVEPREPITIRNGEDYVFEARFLFHEEARRRLRRSGRMTLVGYIPKLNDLIALLRVEVEEEELGEVTRIDMESLDAINMFQAALFDRAEHLVNRINAEPTPEQLAQIRIEIDQVKAQGIEGLKMIKKFLRKTVRFLEGVQI